MGFRPGPCYNGGMCVLRMFLLLCALTIVLRGAERPIVHPGLLHTREDLAFVKARVEAKAEPWYAGFEELRRHNQSSPTWRVLGGYDRVIRGGEDQYRIAEFDLDCNAAYQNALLWCLTGETNRAAKALDIIDAWAWKLKFMGGHDAELGAGLGPFKLINAAELLRYTYTNWTPAHSVRVELMLRRAVLPVLTNFAPHANGNWDAACLKTVMAAGVFCNDRALMANAMEYYLRGEGNGRITHYVIDDTGQCQESGRDQQHTQLGLGCLAETCEIAWHQGIDLYGVASNRLLRGFSYTARYNLGRDVPFRPYTDVTGKYRAKKISDESRGELRPIYEMVWNHYGVRRGLPAPDLREAALKTRPEGAAHGADHPGFGTLMYVRDAGTRP